MFRNKVIIPLFAFAILIAGFVATGCDYKPSVDDQMQQVQETSLEEANRQVGMPNIVHWAEKKLLKWIYELRDTEQLPTYTYLVDMQGKLHFLCHSLGYGIPYGTQFSNPERVVRPYSGVYTNLPQAEPNGLYMPPTAEGTWIVAVGKDGKAHPIYVEPRVIVSPIPLGDEPKE